LGWKLFLSHFAVVVVGSAVLGVVAYFHAPRAFATHVMRMRAMIGADQGLADDLQRSFFEAIGEILLVSGGTAAFAALMVSSFVAWRIISPIRSLTAASRRISAGDYRERVQPQWDDELADLARSFNRMAESLDATEQRRVELIGNLAHELKTPLTSIRSMMEGVIDGVLPADPATFQDIQRETRRLERLTEELRELSRAEAGEVSLSIAPCDPIEPVRQVLTRLESQFVDKDVSLRRELPTDLPPVAADSERLVQVLTNLIGNALQYTDPRGTVTVRVSSVWGAVRYEVDDTGVGLESGDIPRIFERFYRVEKSRSRRHGGSGIGLTIAAHLVRAHGGKITAESDGPGRGSTFSFNIPVAE
jgi:histidine kinase